MLQISQKTFLLGGLAAFLIAAALLFTFHHRALDPEKTGDWWAMRFVEPSHPKSLAFEIENYTHIESGHYTVSIDGKVIEEKDFTLSDHHARFDPQIPAGGGQVKITVQLGEEKQFLTR